MGVRGGEGEGGGEDGGRGEGGGGVSLKAGARHRYHQHPGLMTWRVPLILPR